MQPGPVDSGGARKARRQRIEPSDTATPHALLRAQESALSAGRDGTSRSGTSTPSRRTQTRTICSGIVAAAILASESFSSDSAWGVGLASLVLRRRAPPALDSGLAPSRRFGRRSQFAKEIWELFRKPGYGQGSTSLKSASQRTVRKSDHPYVFTQ